MTVRKLAIVGASARAAAFSARRAGFEVVTADLFADADLERVASATRVENYPEGLADWLATVDCDAWMYTGALENYPELVDRMAGIAPLAGNDGTVLQNVRDPFALQSAMRQAGLSFPETVAYSEGLPLDGSWLCKTYRGASGSGVWALDSEAALARAERERAVFQKRLDKYAVLIGIVFALGAERSELLGFTLQFTGVALPCRDNPWQYSGSMSWWIDNSQCAEQLVRLRDVLARHFSVRGLVGVDAIIDEQNRLWILEVNPRYSASVEVVERAKAKSSIAAHLAACGFADWKEFGPSIPVESEHRPVRSVGKKIVYAKRTVEITDKFYRWAMQHCSVELASLTIADIPRIGENIREGHPVVTVFADAPGFTCDHMLKARCDEVEARLYGAHDPS